MAGFELKYTDPSSMVVTSWAPTQAPLMSSPGRKRIEGIVADPVMDPRIQYGNRFHVALNEYTYRFGSLTFTEAANFDTFATLVGNQLFQFREGTDAICDEITSFRDVRFAPVGFERTWQRMGRGKVGATITLIDAIVP